MDGQRLVWRSRGRLLVLAAAAVGVAAVLTAGVAVAQTGSVEDPLPRFEEDHAALAYSLRWFQPSDARRSGGAGMVSTGAGNAMEVIFTGPDVRWLTTTHSTRGIAQIHIDGVDHGTVDTYGSTAFQVPVFTATGLGAGPHTLRITNTGTAHPDATDTRIEVDAIEAADVVALNRFEEDHAAVAHSSGWRSLSNPHRSGGAGIVSTRAGNAMEVIFTGPDVRWLTTTHSTRGIAQIHIDGVDHGTVDTYGPTAFQVPVFTATGLGAGPHTLRITNTGTAHPDATDTRIEVDAIEAADVVTLSRFEEDHAAVAHSSGWERPSNPHRSGGAGIVSRGGAGNAMEVIFTGPDVRWLTTTHSTRGIAQIHIDGVDHGTVDTYSPATVFQVPVFTATGLGAGPHTLRITNTGTAHPDATDTRIEVDAIEAADVVVVDRPPVGVADDLSTVTTATLAADVFTTNGHGHDYLGVPSATLASFGGGDLGGDVTTHTAGSSVALAGGTLTLGADGALTLTGPAAGGVYSFDYRLANTAGDADATVTITVDQPPAAADDAPASDSSPADAWHTALDTTLDSTTHATPAVLDNDTVGFPAAPLTSFGGGDLGGAVTDHAAGATATVDGHSLAVGAEGHLLYTPKTGYTGLFTFSYRIANTLGTSDATVTIAVGERPAAVADTYPGTLVANVGIDTATTATPFSVLGNDSGDDLTVTLGAPTDGEVTLNTDGTFAFDPAAGFRSGNATFTYTLTNGFGTTPPATVAIPVGAQAIWFVDNTAPECTTLAAGCGRLSRPLSSLAAFQAINDGVGSNPADNHHVFLSESATAHAGPVTLRAGQRLIGQDATSPLATLTGVTPPPHSPALPTMNPAAPATTITGGVTLDAGNHVHGLTLGDAATALAGTTVGALTIDDVTITTTGRALDLANGTANATFTGVSSSGGSNNIRLAAIDGTVDLGGGALSGSTSEAVLVTGGTATVNYTGAITNTANRSVAISGKTGGTVTLAGQITDTGTGIALTDNTGATTAFTGTLSLTTPATGFAATGGGTVSATGTGSTLTATTGPALNIQNTAIHSDGVAFQRVSSSGGANGIVLASTGSAGGLSVTGAGTAGSGGTIQGASGDGISLSSTRGVALDRMIIQSNLGSGINGTAVTDFALTDSTVSGNGDDVAADEAGMRFDNLHGTASVTNTTVSGSIEDNARVINTSGTLALAVTGSTIRDTNPGAGGNNGLLVQASGTASITAGIHGSSFLRNRANGVQVVTNDAGSIAVGLGTTAANTFSDNNIGVSIAHNSSGTLTYHVANSTFNAPTKTDTASPINLNLAFFGATMSGTVSGNTISNNNSMTGPGIRVISNGTGTMTVALTNNSITQVANYGIETLARDGSSTINATYTGNTITLNHAGALDGIRVNAGAVSTDTTSVCADLSGNTVSTSATSDIRVRNRFAGTTFRLEGYAGSANDMAAVAAYLQGRNTITTAAADHSGNAGFLNSAGCPTP